MGIAENERGHMPVKAGAIVKTEGLLLNKHKYDTYAIKEDEISWEIQNQIHRLLNIAFAGLSTKFIAKTYSYERPTSRILGWENNRVVGHMGALEDTLYLDDAELAIGKLGLWATDSTTKGWGTEICHASMAHLKKLNFKIAIGMTSNPIIINHIVPKFGAAIRLLDIRIQGTNFSSKNDTFAMLFNINMDKNKFDDITKEILNIGKIKIQGEPF